MAEDDGSGKIITLPDGTTFLSAPRWVFRYAGVAKRFFSRPAAWLIFVLTGGWVTYNEAAARLSATDNPLAPVGILVDEYLFQTILLPAAVSLWESMLGTVDTLSVIIFGGDRALGTTPGTTPGIADLPLVVADIIIAPIQAVFGDITGQIASMNASVAAAVEPLGLAAPMIVTGLWTLEIFAGLWLTWTLAEAIPGIDVTDIVLSYTAPIRNILRGLT